MQVAELAARAASAAHAAASTAEIGKSSEFYGVTWFAPASQWRAYVWRGGTTHHIAYCDVEKDAARAVDEWLLDNGRRRVNLDDDGLPLEQQSTYDSIYVGVYKSGGNWRAQIKVNKKKEYLGTFVTQREAALAYDRRARELGKGTNFRRDGTCNELGPRGKVLTQVEEGPAS